MSGASDTIYAIASGQGRAALCLVRLSGARSGAILDALCGTRPPPRHAGLRHLRDRAGRVLDRSIVLWLPGPGSYTGEDSAELHLHAGAAVCDGVTAALEDAGARPAEAGEFSRRAVLHGRMELTEAEAVADLIAAETAAQRDQALDQMAGGLRDRIDEWAGRMRGLLAGAEADIDFPDEVTGDPSQSMASGDSAIAALRQEIAGSLSDGARAERLRQGLVFAVVGAPNAGKSSLVNLLAGRDAAIVSPIAGTTRDVLEVHTVLGGVPVLLLDTAGLRDSDDPVEQEGVRRARARAAAADLVIHTVAADHPMTDTIAGDTSLTLTTKADLASAAPAGLAVSVMTGAGIADLRRRLDAEAQRLTCRSGPPPLTRERHRAACTIAETHLAAAMGCTLPELRAEELRGAMLALGRVTGRIGVEQLLDTVFSQFCIGK